jgi:hypothetical protein
MTCRACSRASTARWFPAGGTGRATRRRRRKPRPFGRFFSYLPAARLDAAYRLAAPWAELALTTRYDGRSFGGAPTDWHNVLARK